MTAQPDRASLILSANGAMLGAISSVIRAVLVKADNEAIYVTAVIDGPISEEDRGAISLVATEIAADFSDFQVYDECVRADAPEPIPGHKGWLFVFERREPHRHQ
jgi:hypothetical protein